jgi:hypothetical protein
VTTILGSLLVLVGLAFAAGGGVMLWADQTQRDSQGFLLSPREHLSTPTHAITAGYERTSDALRSDSLAFDVHGSWFLTSDRLGTLRIHARTDTGAPLFIGIAPTGAVERYLASSSHATLTGFPEGDAEYTTSRGAEAPARPADQTIWAARSQGTGDVAVTWPVRRGHWTVVLMNSSARPGVSAEGRLGAKLDSLGAWAAGFLGAGVLILAGGTALVVTGIRRTTSASGTT